MYHNSLVDLSLVNGKITIKSNKYVMYEIGREYHKDKKYNVPIRVTIGLLDKDDNSKMRPNEKFNLYFPDIEISTKSIVNRSSCIRVGSYILISKIIKDYKLDELLSLVFKNDGKLMMDLVMYYLIEETNASVYYPDFARYHPLFSEDMKIYSDAKISSFLKEVTNDDINTFLNAWALSRPNKEGIYISYDSTNKNCQATDIELAEYGHAKDDDGKPIVNIAIGFDVNNREPIFCEEYLGSINDVSQLSQMIKKIKGLGYTNNIGFILDRGYFSKRNIEDMDGEHMSFIIACKGKAKFINGLVSKAIGTFEKDRKNRINRFSCYGTTIVFPLFGDNVNRYIHIYYNELKAAIERENIEAKVERISNLLKKNVGKKKDYNEYNHYFDLIYKDGFFVAAMQKDDVIEKEKEYCGYFVIVSSKEINALDALTLYKSRDESEKLFLSDKSFLSGRAFRVQSDAAIKTKTLISFIALIVRNKIHTYLSDYIDNTHINQNYLNVESTIKELEKIEMIKGNDNIYRLDHALSKTQKTILKAFNIDQAYILNKANVISKELKRIMNVDENGNKNNLSVKKSGS